MTSRSLSHPSTPFQKGFHVFVINIFLMTASLSYVAAGEGAEWLISLLHYQREDIATIIAQWKWKVYF